MKKLLLGVGLVAGLISLNGCGGDDDYGQTPYYTIYDGTQIPKKFSLNVQNVSTKNLKYWLEDKEHKKIFERKVNKKDTEKIFCTEYSNEELFIAYDCIVAFNDKNKEQEKLNIILKKNIQYSFKLLGEIPRYRTDIGGTWYDSTNKTLGTFTISEDK